MLAFARVWAVFLGGMLVGAGALLHAQVVCIQLAREEVQGTFFLARAIGGLTFAFQDEVTQAALWADEIPATVLLESYRVAWTLVVIGVLCVVCSWFMRRSRRRRA